MRKFNALIYSAKNRGFAPKSKTLFLGLLNSKCMTLRRIAGLILVFVCTASFAQETSEKSEQPAKKTFRPDIPGSIMIELGINATSGAAPTHWSPGFWGSRTFNVYYQYPLRLFKSNISLVPGIGLSLERWKMTNYYTLSPTANTDGTFPLVSANDLHQFATIKRSMIVNNYLEIPLELRYDTNPEDIARSLSVSIGGRVGVLYDSFTKLDYREFSENKSLKDKQWHGMNQFRYGIISRIGIGGFSMFGYFNLSPMFEAGKGPEMTTMSSMTFGISVSGF